MKKIYLFLLFLLISQSLLLSKIYAQENNESDYLAIGIFGGAYLGNHPLYQTNSYLNSIAIEAEYFKFSDLSFYVQGLYEFTPTDVKTLFEISNAYPVSVIEKPETYRLNISFGGRYYLRKKNVNPFFQFGINHEVNHIGRYNYSIELLKYTEYYQSEGYYIYKLSANIGVGLSVKMSKEFNIELKYDIYKSIIREEIEFTAYSVLAGLKYNM